MDPDTNSIEISSPCSCDDCDTLRCLTRKHENDDKLTNPCIFFTKVAIKKTSSNTDTARNEITPLTIKSAQETECEICRRCITKSESACTLINVSKTSKSICESCIRNIKKIKQQTNNADLVIIDAKPSVTNDTTDTEYEDCKPKENYTRDVKFEIYGQDPLTQQRPTRKSKCKICIRDFQTHDNIGDVNIDTTSFEKMRTIEKLPNKPSFYNLCKHYFPPNIDTANSKVCKKDIENSEFAEGLEKINKNTSQCKFCKKYVISQDRADDFICNICKVYIPAKETTDAGKRQQRPMIFELCQNYLPNNINKTAMHILETVKTKCKLCKNYTENADEPNMCKLCTKHSHENMIDSICKTCKAYFPITLYTNTGNKNLKQSMFELCPNQLQGNTNDTSVSIKDIIKTKCKGCKKYTETEVARKRCKLCRRYVDSLQDMVDSICKICKVYFPSNLYTNSRNTDAKSSLFELCPNYLQKNSNETSMNILETVKRKCSRCKNYIESNFRQKRCKYCRRFVDSHQAMLEPICKICKAYIPSNYTDAQSETIGTAKFKSNTCRKALEDLEINIDRIATICGEESQTRKIKPIKCKVCTQDIETKNKIKFVTAESKCTENPKYNVCKRAFEDWETNIGRTNAYDSDVTRIDSHASLYQDCSINKYKLILRPTEIKCTGESQSKVCTMCIEEFQEAIDKMIGLRKESDEYNLNYTPCTDCRMDRVSSEIIATEGICTDKSKCKVCRSYVDEWEVTMGKNAATYKNIIPLCQFCRRDPGKKGCSDTVITNITPLEKICTGKSKCKDCIGDIEEWKTVTCRTPPDTLNKVTSLCQLCRKDNETEKCNNNFCRRNVEDWQVHVGRKSPNKKINSKSSQCRYCRMDSEKKDHSFENKMTSTKHNYVTKCSIRDIEIPNLMDTVNNDLKRQNTYCPPHVVEGSQKMPCYFKKSESETKLCNRPLREDIHPSTLKLSAQIMNVPYEEFKQSLNQEINEVDKATMKSTLSYDIIKRIKQAYKACSCKVCECLIGKSLTQSNVCNCKPCDCEDCKSFKHLSHDIQSESRLNYLSKIFPKEVSVAKKIQDQPCSCTPCSCIECSQIPTEATTTAKSTCLLPVRTYIAARVAENRHADNCTCPACHCAECERNFFSLSTHVTHEMSTGMMRSCRCEQCLDQRCRGAGGTDECRCEMPSKAIFKPVEKDSHDYGIHRAAVCHQRHKRNYCRDPIAMYATVSSNYSQLGTVKEGCSCEECECISCKGVNSKMSIKTLLKPQPASQMRYTRTNTCDSKACESENCSYAINIPEGHVENYKDAECNCDECACMNCHSVSKSMIAKLVPLAKPIGKIYYRNNVKECTDNIPITGCTQPMCDNKQQHVCRKTIVRKNCYHNKDYNTQINKYSRYCCLDSKNTTLAKTCSVSQDFTEQMSPQYTTASKYFDNNLNKVLNHTSYRDKGHVGKGNTHCQSESNKCCRKNNKSENSGSSVSNFSGSNHANCDKKYEYEKKTINLQPSQFTLSNYKADCPKTTLETCLNDILTLDDDFSLKMGSKINKPNISYNTASYDYEKNQDIDDIDVYDYNIEPFSNNHRNFYNKNLNGVQIYEPAQNDICNKCKIKTQSNICNIPSVVNCNNNFVKNPIDYARVHNTLREAKDFSDQLIKLLDKYERANREFHSVSEKLKLSHESNECSKLKDNVQFQLDYVVIEKQKNIPDNIESVNGIENVNYGLNDIKISSCSINYGTNNSNHTQDAIILIKSEQKENSSRNKIVSVGKEHQSEQNANLTNDINLEITDPNDNGQYYLKFDDINENPATTEVEEIVDISQRTFKSSLITTNNIVIPEVKTCNEPIEDKSTEQFLCVDNKVTKLEDIANNYQIQGKENTIRKNIEKNKYPTQIDILTNQLSEIIKENLIKNNEETASSHINKYDTTIETSENFLSKVNNDGSQESLNRTNFHFNNLNFYIPPYGLIFFKDEDKAKTLASSVQTTLKRHSNKKYKIERVIHLKSSSSLPRNKTTQVDKESDTHVDYLTGKNRYQKLSGSTLKSKTDSDLETQSRFSELSSKRHSAMGKAKCSCEFLKVGFLGGRRVSDHTVMVKWSKPKDLRNVQGYELLVDGRPVQTIIDSSRCMAVVTCLPNSDRILLTMKTILLVATKSGHEPSVTIVYHPRQKKNKKKT